MDFSFDFNFDEIPVYRPSDDNHQLKEKINELEKNKEKIDELEKYKEETKINHQITSMNVITLIEHAKLHEDRLKLHEERLNRHSQYCESIYKKINTFENDNLQKFIRKNTENTIQNIKIQEIIQKQKEQEKQIIELQEIIQKQKEQEKQIIELKKIIQEQKEQEKQIIELKKIIQEQKEQEKQIIELKKIIQEQKEPEKQIIELQNIIQEQKEPETQIIKSKEVITQEIPKKRNFDDVTNDYIERLILTKKRSKPWSDGMSKYISITLVNDRWRWESSIFDENHINFKLKEDAEKYFETLIEKYNIDPIYITRIGYEDNKS